MSLIWIILVNTIIGMVLYPISIAIAVWYADRKYGIDVTEESGQDNLNNVEDLSTILGISNKLIIYLTVLLTVIFWEIGIPINIYCGIAKIKDLHEIRGGDERKITRIKDLKASAVKADIRYAKNIIEYSKKKRLLEIEIFNAFLDDPNFKQNDDACEFASRMIKTYNNEIKIYDTFLEDMKKYH